MSAYPRFLTRDHNGARQHLAPDGDWFTVRSPGPSDASPASERAVVSSIASTAAVPCQERDRTIITAGGR